MSRSELNYDRSNLRTKIKSLIGRNFTGIDTVLDDLINVANELFGNTVSSVYDEFVYTHTISSGEVTSKTDEYNLPNRTKCILDAYYIDVSGSDDVYYPIHLRSPIDFNEASGYQMGTSYGRASFDYGTETIKFGPGYQSGRSTRADHTGIPQLGYRVNNAFHVFPTPGSSEQANKIRLMLGMFPADLQADGDKNSVTKSYPQALITYTAALFWGLHMNDANRAQQYLTTAQLLLASFAKQDEINKLVNISLRLPN
jgi:hypothetical protein